MSTTTIYKATYSGVPVLEMPCQGIAVMRRRSDSWLNATQILKVAGFDKPQRTRVLEREIQKGIHEKIQGGYGKYQGTWVPLDRGISLAKQYGVDHLLAALFDFQPSSTESPPLAPKHSTAPPARAKATRNRASTSARIERPAPSTTGLGGRNTNNSWSNFDSDGERNALPAASSRESNGKWPTQSKLARSSNLTRARANLNNSNPDAPSVSASAQAPSRAPTPTQPLDPDNSLSITPSEPSLSSRAASPIEDVSFSSEAYKPTRNKGKSRRLPDPIPKGPPTSGRVQKRKHDISVVESPPHSDGAPDQSTIGNPLTAASAKYARMILDYFIADSSQIPSFLNDPPPDFDANVMIDADGHTALHWACAMGQLYIVNLLLACGATFARCNNVGQTPLMRAVMFTNNHDLKTFPQLYQACRETVGKVDRRDRTVFHYVSDLALIKGKAPSARYYLKIILKDLSYFPQQLLDMLNFQDENGETPLTLAAQCNSRRLIKILLRHGANPRTANRQGKTAEDYILAAKKLEALSPTPCSSGPARQLDHSSDDTSDSSGHSDMDELIEAAALHANLVSANESNQFQRQYSETGQKVKNVLLPEVTSLMECLQAAFDAEFHDQDRDLNQANGLLSNIQNEFSEGQRKILNFDRVLSDFQEKKSALAQLEKELDHKLCKRYRFGWEKYVRDEQEREKRFQGQQKLYLDQLSIEDRNSIDLESLKFEDSSKQEILMKLIEEESENSDLVSLMKIPETGADLECDLLRESLKKLTEEREKLFKEFINLSSENAAGESEEDGVEGDNNWSTNRSRLNAYRKLISLGCGGIALDEVDEVIESLNEGIDANEMNENYLQGQPDDQVSCNGDRHDRFKNAGFNTNNPNPDYVHSSHTSQTNINYNGLDQSATHSQLPHVLN